jgi:4-amino-4-deoxy-L-arabinose transferase-like glycosyltransferase
MLKTPGLERIERQILLLISILLVVALYLNLGIYPLLLEEPRRGLIALEMIFSKNWIVPTQNGELYFRKPPIYNWVLIFSYKLFGNYSELATRFFSVSSFVAMGVVFFRFCKQHLNERIAAYSALFFMVSADILFYFSALGEIDLFYSFVTLMVFIVIYNFGEKKQYYGLFLLAYLLSAVGFLTKGVPSIAFLGISLLAYFYYKKDLKRLFSVAHLLGAALFLLLVGSYFWGYSLYEDPSGWYSTLASESSDRTTKTDVLGIVKHLFSFPIDTLKNILPAAFFLPLLFRKDLIKVIKKESFIAFLALIFTSNIILYLISTGARSRYVYALYPFIIAVIVYVVYTSDLKWRDNLIKVVAIFVAVITILANASLYFIPDLELLEHLVLKSVVLTICSSLLLTIILKIPKYRLAMLIVCFVILRFDFSLIMPVSRAATSSQAIDKVDGFEIAEITKDEDLILFDDTQISRTTTFYIEAKRKDVLRRNSDMKKGFFLICSPEDTLGRSFTVYKAFKYRSADVLLVK